MTPEQKQAYEDQREFQIAMEHERRARNEAEGVLSLQQEATEAWDAFRHHQAGAMARHLLRLFRL